MRLDVERVVCPCVYKFSPKQSSNACCVVCGTRRAPSVRGELSAMRPSDCGRSLLQSDMRRGRLGVGSLRGQAPPCPSTRRAVITIQNPSCDTTYSGLHHTLHTVYTLGPTATMAEEVIGAYTLYFRMLNVRRASVERILRSLCDRGLLALPSTKSCSLVRAACTTYCVLP